jgi:hypothetical protein
LRLRSFVPIEFKFPGFQGADQRLQFTSTTDSPFLSITVSDSPGIDISPSMGQIAATTAYNIPRLPAVDGLVAHSHVTETSFALSFESYRLLWLLAQSPP